MGKTFKSGHSFPASFGFSGSAGKQCVRGYMRGGPVKSNATMRVAPSDAETIDTGFTGKELRRGYAKGGQPKVRMAIMADGVDKKTGKVVKLARGGMPPMASKKATGRSPRTQIGRSTTPQAPTSGGKDFSPPLAPDTPGDTLSKPPPTSRQPGALGRARGVPAFKAAPMVSKPNYASRARRPGGYAEGGWIKGAIKHPGALHKQLGVPQGKKIPAGKLNAAAEKGGKLGQRARLAQTLKGFNK